MKRANAAAMPVSVVNPTCALVVIDVQNGTLRCRPFIRLLTIIFPRIGETGTTDEILAMV